MAAIFQCVFGGWGETGVEHYAINSSNVCNTLKQHIYFGESVVLPDHTILTKL